MKIAVIGKIGSGKTVFLRAAAERKDVVCVYADELNRSLFSDAGYLARLKELFPEAFLGGVFDKKALANVVFADKKKRLLLNALAHPEITRLAGGIIKDAEKEGKHIVFEVPLLAESGMAGMFDEVVCIKAPEAVRLERIKARDGMTAEEAAARDKSASKESEKLASVVIENDGAKEEFLRKVNLFLDSVFD